MYHVGNVSQIQLSAWLINHSSFLPDEERADVHPPTDGLTLLTRTGAGTWPSPIVCIIHTSITFEAPSWSRPGCMRPCIKLQMRLKEKRFCVFVKCGGATHTVMEHFSPFYYLLWRTEFYYSWQIIVINV